MVFFYQERNAGARPTHCHPRAPRAATAEWRGGGAHMLDLLVCCVGWNLVLIGQCGWQVHEVNDKINDKGLDDGVPAGVGNDKVNDKRLDDGVPASVDNDKTGHVQKVRWCPCGVPMCIDTVLVTGSEAL